MISREVRQTSKSPFRIRDPSAVSYWRVRCVVATRVFLHTTRPVSPNILSAIYWLGSFLIPNNAATPRASNGSYIGWPIGRKSSPKNWVSPACESQDRALNFSQRHQNPSLCVRNLSKLVSLIIFSGGFRCIYEVVSHDLTLARDQKTKNFSLKQEIYCLSN